MTSYYLKIGATSKKKVVFSGRDNLIDSISLTHGVSDRPTTLRFIVCQYRSQLNSLSLNTFIKAQHMILKSFIVFYTFIRLLARKQQKQKVVGCFLVV